MKFILVLSAFLLAIVSYVMSSKSGSVSSLSTLADSQISSTEKVTSLTKRVVGSIDKSQGSLITAQEKSAQLVEKLRSLVNESVHSMQNQYAELLKKINSEMIEIFPAGTKPNEGCKQMTDTVSDTVAAVPANAIRCVTDQLEAGLQHSANIIKISKNLNDEYKDLRLQILNCTKSLNTSKILRAIICFSKVGTLTGIATTVKISEVTGEVARLNLLVATFQKSVEECSAMTGFKTLGEHIDVFFNGVKECVKKALESDKQLS